MIFKKFSLKKLLSGFGLLLILFIYSCEFAPVPKKLPVSFFFRNPNQIRLKISPNGVYLAYLQAFQGRMNLNVKNIKTGEVVQITNDLQNDIFSYKWGNNDKIFFLRDSSKNERYHLFLIGRVGGIPEDLTPYSKINISWWEDDRPGFNKLFFAMNHRKEEIQDLYEFNLRSHKTNLVLSNPGYEKYTSIKKDFSGTLRVIMSSNGLSQTYLYRDRDDEKFKTIFTTNFKDHFSPISFDATNNTLYVSSNRGRDKSVIVQIDPKTGKEIKVIFENPKFDSYDLYYSFIRQKPLFASYYDWKNRMEFLDTGAEKNLKQVQNALPNFEIRMVDLDSSENQLLLRAFNDRNWGYYYLYNLKSHILSKLTNLSPWIKETDMASMKPIQFQARDGLIIHGYLTLPNLSTNRRLPLIVNIHSGPHTRNNWSFDRESQFFANRGYAVLQINYRGSSGYGKKFYEASFKQWGKKIQDDISDGTRWAIRQGIADSGRIALYGIGFGGYCALLGEIREPNLYKCIISYGGISNLFDYINDVPIPNKILSDRLYETIGNPITDFNYIKSVSPVFHVDMLKCPILIAQGGKDNRVNINETDYFVKELQKKGVNVMYFVKPEEGRVFTKEENKIEFFKQVEIFLDQNFKLN